MNQDELNPNTQTAVLLTARLGSNDTELVPLTAAEFRRVRAEVHSAGLQLADILDDSNLQRVSESASVSCDQAGALLGRGFALAVAQEKWAAAGIWVIGDSDASYPECYSTRLEDKAPPVLYGVGDPDLLQGGGLAVVGSRRVDEHALEFTAKVGRACAKHGVQVLSGGARGVDAAATAACVEDEGTAVSVVSDSLARHCLSPEVRNAVMSKSLLLVSPFEPETTFLAWKAMDRNKLIYALADYVLVVSSDHKKGGTWAGAEENLKHGWVPLFVRAGADVPDGNTRLLEKGAIALDESVLDECDVIEWMKQKATENQEQTPQEPDVAQGTLPL